MGIVPFSSPGHNFATQITDKAPKLERNRLGQPETIKLKLKGKKIEI
jgi:hypothetical protein